MGKVILMSCTFATLLLPMLAASQPNPRKGLKKLVRYWLAFNLFYAIAIVYIVPRLP